MEKSIRNYKAYQVQETDKGFKGSVVELSTDDLPKNDTLVQVYYSSLNYKDALSATGNKGVSKDYPHTPGIDAVGIVVETAGKTFKVGDKVIVTSYDLGMNTPGGFGQYICVPSEWIVSLPEKLSMEHAMLLGTAGLTAAAGIDFIVRDVKPESGNVLVTGATGGVGSVAVLLLSQLGYQVVASTGKKELEGFLKELGASAIISREELSADEKRPLKKGQWAAVYDTVGGKTLENAIKATNPFGVVSCCGNVSSPDLALTVFPFILRGVKLMGISSQNLPMDQRIALWDKLANEWMTEKLTMLQQTIALNELGNAIENILQGKIKGRVVVKHEIES